MSAIQSVGFIGLGALGTVLARNLLEDGLALHVWARRDAAVAEFAASGARVATSPADLAAAVDCIVLCVTDTQAVESLVFGPQGLAATCRTDAVVIDHSTIHPVSTQAFARRLREQRAAGWVDAPVSGGVIGAEARRLTVMAGGAAEDFERVRPVLAASAARITHLGPAGSGQAAKTANQMIIGATVAVVAEALNLAADFGVEAAALPDALAGGWADSAVLQHHARRMTACDYSGEVDARIMVKDLDIAADVGRATHSPTPATALARALYSRLVAQGDSDKGQSGLMWLYRQTPT